MSELEIYQDCEFNGMDFESPTDVFWTKGHGHDPRTFIRAILTHCLDNYTDIPAIPCDVEPMELWQRNAEVDGGVEYHRDPAPPASPRTSRFPITLLDLEGNRRRGGTKCSVIGCSDPWSSGPPVLGTCRAD